MGALHDIAKCACCPNESAWLTTVGCPALASDDMGESDGSVCWLCGGTGEIRICASCFYLGPDRDGEYGGGDAA